MELNFVKMHGLGNDFVVVDGMTREVRLTPDQIRNIAHRRLGVGCDQLLVLQASREAGVNARFRIFNADGGEVEQCGNGARCAAEFLRNRGYVRDTTVTLQTAAGLLRVYFDGVDGYRVNMGVPEFEPSKIPLRVPARQPLYTITLPAGAIEFSAVSLGNPHAVVAVDDVETAPVESVGAALQAQPMFPRGINVGFMQIADRANIRLRVYERGAGETMACGSGACAAVVAGRLNHGLDESVAVELPGGRLGINWKGEGEPIWMKGPAVTVYEGRIRL